MNDIFYLESDEEITSVIDRLRKAESKGVVLVIPRGGTLGQSIVNLKLLRKSAKDLDLDFCLVTGDRVCKNLASQIGITIFSKVAEAEEADLSKTPQKVDKPTPDEISPNGDFKINSYYNRKDEEVAEEVGATETDETPEEEMGQEEEFHDDKPIEEKKPVEQIKAREDQKAKKDEEPDHNLKPFSGTNKKNISGSKKPLLIIIAVSLVLALIISYIFIPFANASIKLKTEEFTLSQDLKVDQTALSADVENNILPGTEIKIEKEGTKTYNSTGTKEAGEKASGKITVYNEWSTTPETLNKGTRFISGGKAFLLQSDILVPGAKLDPNPPIKFIAGSIEASVTAENSGESYNIGPTSFTISSLPSSQQAKIYGRSSVAMAGGTTKILKVITADDIKNASKDLFTDISTAGKADVIARAEETEVLIFEENNVNSAIVSEEPSKAVDTESETFDYRMKVELKTLGFQDSQAKKMMVEKVNKQLNSDQMIVNEDKSEVLYSFTAADKTFMTVEADFKGRVGKKLEKQTIINEITNKKAFEAKNIIQKNEAVDQIDLKIWPSPLFRVPMIKSRIQVKFDYAE